MPTIPNDGGGHNQIRPVPGGPRAAETGQSPGSEQQQQGVQETGSLDPEASGDASAGNVPE